MENKVLSLNQPLLCNFMASCMVETIRQVASLVLSQAENCCSISLDSHSRSTLPYLLTDHLCNPIHIISSITSLRNTTWIFFIFDLRSWNSA